LATLSGDQTLIARLPFYRVAYLAHRLGYASLAARTLGPLPDGARMAMLVHRYGRQLRRAIAELAEPCAERARARRDPGGLDVVVAPDGRATPR
jgi:hypothetical protein